MEMNLIEQSMFLIDNMIILFLELIILIGQQMILM
jgi:hypothetical protein